MIPTWHWNPTLPIWQKFYWNQLLSTLATVQRFGRRSWIWVEDVNDELRTLTTSVRVVSFYHSYLLNLMTMGETMRIFLSNNEIMLSVLTNCDENDKTESMCAATFHAMFHKFETWWNEVALFLFLGDGVGSKSSENKQSSAPLCEGKCFPGTKTRGLYMLFCFEHEANGS